MFTFNCKGSLWILNQPIVMGIINTTPDSFFAGSRNASFSAAKESAFAMVDAGVGILDIGGQSTRPGSSFIDAETEKERVIPIISLLRQYFPQLLISIDTFHPAVAIAAVEAGASIVNDISGGRFYSDMFSIVAALKVPYICMHSSGTVETMHEKINYNDISSELCDYFTERIAACEAAGINDIILDPGFGFGKTVPNNFTLLKEMVALKKFGKPILLGVSRKSTIYQTLQITAEESLNGTTVLNTLGLMNGADILRVHDVKEAVECIKLCRMAQ
ncbi:MAG: dihydropteroate synthase [Sphingobacteriia bacterium]|nr:MAG: dihydropteroate synthase [Sphingobacteriia bacterium]TAG29741.1 MAG: dihydropteroate synthase [Sphingobacteriia bacterium]TAH06473.1 MAG: dihydropteroate synthase [Sphingobacteriia bacterium]